MFHKLLSLTFLLLLKTTFCANQNPIVELPNGKISGRRAVTFANTSYYSFKKIPYATPPTGELRFKAPQPAQNWDDILDADTEGTSCFQLGSSSTPVDSEDCLFINVFTPQLPEDDPDVSLPVMLFIHGGAFILGSSMSALPDLFLDNGVVYVSINYRLGLLGFLSTEDEVIPGNNGLKDQLLALQWTHDNIHLFGGDPDKITIFGQSAGSGSVAFQLLNQKAQGLFRAAILESGTSLMPAAIQREPRRIAFDFAASLNSTFEESEDSEALLQFLQSVDATELNAAFTKYYSDLHADIFDLIFGPVIEVKNPDAFITKKMYGLFQAGNVLTVPSLIGFNSEENLAFNTDPEIFKATVTTWDENLELIIPKDMNIEDPDKRADMARQIRDIYTNGEPFSDNLGAGIRYLSDNSFVRAIIKHAELFSAFGETYFYEFSYDGKLGDFLGDVHYDGAENVAHGEELLYLFCSGSDCDDSTYPESDRLTRKRLIKIWTDFAKYLNPTPESSDLLQNITWPRLSVEDGDYLYVDINENLEIKNHPRDDTYKKWTQLYNSLDSTDFDTY